eukprot:2561833-Alexandrium_andersonii.AAC.1
MLSYIDESVIADEAVDDERRSDASWWQRQLPGCGTAPQRIVTVVRFDLVDALAAGFAQPRCMGPRSSSTLRTRTPERSSGHAGE